MWTFDREDVRAKLEGLEDHDEILIGPKPFETDTLVLKQWTAQNFLEAQENGRTYRSVTIPPHLRPRGKVEARVLLKDNIYYTRHKSTDGAAPWLKHAEQVGQGFPWDSTQPQLDSSDAIEQTLQHLSSLEACLQVTTTYYTMYHQSTMNLGIQAWAKTMDQWVRDETTEVWAVGQHE